MTPSSSNWPKAVGLATVLVGAVTVINAAVSGYLCLLTVAGAPRTRRRHAGSASTRFAVLIPAHDEEAVIAETLRALSNVDYPTDQFEVHVVADNCTDRTVAIARALGATVHDRHDPTHRGKGPALNWAYDAIDAGDVRPDVAVVVDADTEVDRGFLAAFDRVFAAGTEVAQGFYTVKEPATSPGTAIRFAALACRHHLRSLGRRRIGGSCGLHGNGMAFRWEILRSHRWTGHLVEDIVLQNELLLDDIVVEYVPDAVVAAEIPERLDDATTQNVRWERGRYEIARSGIPTLLRRLARPRGVSRVALADAVADHLVPPLSVIATAQAANIAASAGLALVRRRPLPSTWASLACSGILTAHVLVALRAVGAPPGVYRHLLHVPRAIVWKSALWARVLRPDHDAVWERTKRNAED